MVKSSGATGRAHPTVVAYVEDVRGDHRHEASLNARFKRDGVKATAYTRNPISPGALHQIFVHLSSISDGLLILAIQSAVKWARNRLRKGEKNEITIVTDRAGNKSVRVTASKDGITISGELPASKVPKTKVATPAKRIKNRNRST